MSKLKDQFIVDVMPHVSTFVHEKFAALGPESVESAYQAWKSYADNFVDIIDKAGWEVRRKPEPGE